MSFRVKRYDIKSNKVTSAEPISLIFLSDLHLTEHGASNCDLIDAIDGLHPDLILVGGDMIVGKEGKSTAVAEELLSRLAMKYTVIYALGNHEQRMKDKTERFGDIYELYQRRLCSCGIHLLDNMMEEIEMKGTSIHIYGLCLPLMHYKRFTRHELPIQEMQERLGSLDEKKINILLAHHPRFTKTYFEWGADLTLSGHIHGGVMRLGKQPVISPDFQLFPKYGYGQFVQDNKQLLISGGLGEHTIPFRIFNPKELLYIEISQEVSHGDSR